MTGAQVLHFRGSRKVSWYFPCKEAGVGGGTHPKAGVVE